MDVVVVIHTYFYIVTLKSYAFNIAFPIYMYPSVSSLRLFMNIFDQSLPILYERAICLMVNLQYVSSVCLLIEVVDSNSKRLIDIHVVNIFQCIWITTMLSLNSRIILVTYF